MGSRRYLVFVLLVCLNLGTMASEAEAGSQTLTIVYPSEENAFHDAAAEIIRRAYARIGITVEYKTFPAERALRMSNDGQSDGELVRIEGIDEKYPNLIRIPVSHVTAEQMAFAQDPTIVIDGWESLRPYTIAFHRGYKVAEKNTIGMDRHLTGKDSSAFNVVENERVDIAIANRFTGEKIIRDLDLTNVTMLLPPIQRDPLFHYVHIKHATLVEEITQILKTMSEQGEFDSILREYGIEALGD